MKYDYILFIAVLAFLSGCSRKHPLIGYWVEPWETNKANHYQGILVSSVNILFMENGTGLRWRSFPQNKEIEPLGHDTINWKPINEHQIQCYVTTNDKKENYIVEYKINNDTLFLYNNESTIVMVRQTYAPTIPSTISREEEYELLHELDL